MVFALMSNLWQMWHISSSAAANPEALQLHKKVIVYFFLARNKTKGMKGLQRTHAWMLWFVWVLIPFPEDDLPSLKLIPAAPESRVRGGGRSNLNSAMMKLQTLRVRNALIRECMAEFLGTFVLLVSFTPGWGRKFLKFKQNVCCGLSLNTSIIIRKKK